MRKIAAYMIRVCVTALLAAAVFAVNACSARDDEERLSAAIDMVESFVQSMRSGNFTVETGGETLRFAGGKAARGDEYFFVENGRNMRVYRGDVWTKETTQTTASALFSSVMRRLGSVEWTALGAGDTLTGRGDGLDATAYLGEMGRFVVGGEEMKVSAVGETEVLVPEAELVADPEAAALTRLYDFVAELERDRNFTVYALTRESEMLYAIDGDLIDGTVDGERKFYETADGVTYEYVSDGESWTKAESEESPDGAIKKLNELLTFSRIAFDAASETYNGYYIQGLFMVPFTVSFTGEELELTVPMYSVRVRVYDVGKSRVVLPPVTAGE